MPIANYLPIAGKYGRVLANGGVCNLAEHEVRAGADDIDTTHFESDIDADLVNVYGEGLVGIVEAEIMTRGMFDGRNNPFDAPFFLFPGLFGTMFAGLTKTYGFTMGYRCLRTPVSTRVRNASAFEAQLKSNGIIVPPVGAAA